MKTTEKQCFLLIGGKVGTFWYLHRGHFMRKFVGLAFWGTFQLKKAFLVHFLGTFSPIYTQHKLGINDYFNLHKQLINLTLRD